ncbi:MAG: fused MFS/spermidine synthase, partial [Actinomycetota bacterium]
MTRRSAIPPLPPGPIAAAHVTVEIRGDGESPGGRLVLMDGVEASHVDLADPTRVTFEYLRHITRLVDAAVPAPRPVEAVQVGGGPCTLARWILATRPGSRVTVVERDPGVVRAARDWLGLRPSPHLRVVVGDGREEVARLPSASADLLVVDAFEGVVAPPRLVSTGFLAEALRVLRPGGIHVVNMIDVPPLGYAAAVAATMAAHLPSVALMADPRVLAHRSSGNLVIAGSPAPLPVAPLERG